MLEEVLPSIPSTSFTLSLSERNWQSSCALSLVCSLVTAVSINDELQTGYQRSVLEVWAQPSMSEDACPSIPSISFTLSRSALIWESSSVLSVACSLVKAVNVKERAFLN